MRDGASCWEAVIVSPDVLVQPDVSPFQPKNRVLNASQPVNQNSHLALSVSPPCKVRSPQILPKFLSSSGLLDSEEEGGSAQEKAHGVCRKAVGVEVMSAVVSGPGKAAESWSMTRADGEPGEGFNGESCAQTTGEKPGAGSGAGLWGQRGCPVVPLSLWRG